MKARAAIVGLLLLAALAVAWWADVLAPAAVAPPAAAPADGAELVRAATQGQNQVAAEALATERSAARERSTARTVRITTVGSDGEPIAGAEVRYVPPRVPAERQRDVRLHEQLQDVEATLRTAGLLAITDANGAVEIEGDERSLVCARSGDLYAQDSLGRADEPWADRLRLELRRDVTLRVEVVGADGQPLPNRTLEVVADGVSVRQGQERSSLTLPPTDENGVVVRTHLLHEIDCSDVLVDGRLVVALERRVQRLVDDRQRAVERVAVCEVPWHELRTVTHVRLVVNAGGALVVRLLDADAREIPRIYGELQDERAGDGVLLEPTWLPDGRMHFEGLPFGRRWLLSIDHSFLEHRVTLVGPVTADTVAVDVTLPVRCFEVSARIVRSDQLPVADASVTVRVAGPLPWACKFTSGGRGRVQFGIWCVPVTIERVTPLEITIQGDQCAPRTLVVDRVIEPGKTDLGDIVVEPPAGETVLARVELRCDGKPANRPWARLLVHQADVWRDVQSIVRRDATGFEFRGMAPPAPMAVSCGADGYMPIANVPVQVGEHKVVDLQLRRGANFEVAVLAPGLPRNAITGVVVRDGDQQQFQDYLDAQQVFRFYQVVPGRYRLRINIDDRVVYETAGLELHAGHNRWPLDGSRIDLRRHEGARCIVARSAATGERLSVGAVQVSPRAVELPPDAEDRQGDERFVPGEPPSDLLVRAEGHVPVRVIAPVGDVVLQLQPSTEVQVAAPGDGDVAIRMGIVDDPVRDPLLRAFDKHHEHEAERELPSDATLRFVPGTLVEFTVLRDGKPGATERAVIGTTSPQRVTLR